MRIDDFMEAVVPSAIVWSKRDGKTEKKSRMKLDSASFRTFASIKSGERNEK